VKFTSSLALDAEIVLVGRFVLKVFVDVNAFAEPNLA
jgi:hypothetical protein